MQQVVQFEKKLQGFLWLNFVLWVLDALVYDQSAGGNDTSRWLPHSMDRIEWSRLEHKLSARTKLLKLENGQKSIQSNVQISDLVTHKNSFTMCCKQITEEATTF